VRHIVLRKVKTELEMTEEMKEEAMKEERTEERNEAEEMNEKDQPHLKDIQEMIVESMKDEKANEEKVNGEKATGEKSLKEEENDPLHLKDIDLVKEPVKDISKEEETVHLKEHIQEIKVFDATVLLHLVEPMDRWHQQPVLRNMMWMKKTLKI
jgi:mannitol-specific phosphotransferase system IIBC component